MLADHPYYCSNSNYYSNDAGATWDTATDFLNEFESCDIDMNLVFRWDIKRGEDGDSNAGIIYAEIFMMHQRKGIFSPHYIKTINEDEIERFHKYLERHWSVLKDMWKPFA